MTEEMTVQKKLTVKKIYTGLKSDLELCIKFLRHWKPENVELYFWTLDRDEIQNQIDVICKPFSEYQLAQIEKVKSDLHTFISKYHNQWQQKKSD